MLDYDFGAPATVVVVPHQPRSGRADIVKHDVNLAGAIRHVIEQMSLGERQRAVIRTPDRSLLFEEIVALYKQPDFPAASGAGEQHRSSEPEGHATPEGAHRREFGPVGSWQEPSGTRRRRTVVRFAAAGVLVVGFIGTAGLLANYCKTAYYGPASAKLAFVTKPASGESCDGPGSPAACIRSVGTGSGQQPSRPAPDQTSPERDSPGPAAFPEARDPAAAAPVGGGMERGAHKVAGRPADASSGERKGVHRRAALDRAATSNSWTRQSPISYQSMRRGSRFVMRDPVAGSKLYN